MEDINHFISISISFLFLFPPNILHNRPLIHPRPFFYFSCLVDYPFSSSKILSIPLVSWLFNHSLFISIFFIFLISMSFLSLFPSIFLIISIFSCSDLSFTFINIFISSIYLLHISSTINYNHPFDLLLYLF